MPAYSLFALPSVLGVAASLTVSGYAWRRRSGPAWPYVVLLGLSVAWWCAGQASWILLDHRPSRMLLAQLQYLGITTTPVLVLLLALAFTGHRGWLRTWAKVAFFIVPAATLLLVFTNPLHGMIWRAFEPVAAAPRAVIAYGPWFYVHTAYSYSLVYLGTALLALRFAASPHYRRELAVVLSGPALVLVANLLQLTARAKLPIDPTPASFALTFVAMTWAVSRHRLFDLAPLARGWTIETMDNGLLVLDFAGRVVDSNPAARSLLGLEPSTVLGATLAELSPALGELGVGEARELRGARGLRLEARLSAVEPKDGAPEGRVLLLRDVTAEREAQDRLLAAQRELHALNQELDRLAHTDALTGLANRRQLMARGAEEWSQARRHGRPLSLVLLDLDHFKAVNDTHGHATGDRVLEGVGRALPPLLRDADLAARYGGEEIAVLLPETDAAGAADVARRVVAALRELPLHDDAGGPLRVTVSAGMATLDGTGGELQELFRQADAALYHVKATGRDGVGRTTPTGPERIAS